MWDTNVVQTVNVEVSKVVQDAVNKAVQDAAFPAASVQAQPQGQDRGHPESLWQNQLFFGQVLIMLTLCVIFMGMRVYVECKKTFMCCATASKNDLRGIVHETNGFAGINSAAASCAPVDCNQNDEDDDEKENSRREGECGTPPPVQEGKPSSDSDEDDRVIVASEEERAAFLKAYNQDGDTYETVDSRQHRLHSGDVANKEGATILIGQAGVMPDVFDESVAPPTGVDTPPPRSLSAFVKSDVSKASSVFLSKTRARLFRLSVYARIIVLLLGMAVLFGLYWLYTSPWCDMHSVLFTFIPRWWSPSDIVTFTVMSRFYAGLIQDNMHYILAALGVVYAWFRGYSLPVALGFIQSRTQVVPIGVTVQSTPLVRKDENVAE